MTGSITQGTTPALSHGQLLRLKRLSTPTIFNGWEQISAHDRRTCVNRGETRDFMPGFGPIVGRAITLVTQASEPSHKDNNPENPARYREYVASVPGPKIVILQDLDNPNVIGTYFGEVNASLHRALGCVGIVTDGGVRDITEMASLGFKALANRLCVGHAYAWPVRWNCAVEVFGCPVQPGQLIHADQHGFMAIPPEDEAGLFDASLFMDGNECDHLIGTAQFSQGLQTDDIRKRMVEGEQRFGAAAKNRLGRGGEWSTDR